jgi:hypothetical protein
MHALAPRGIHSVDFAYRFMVPRMQKQAGRYSLALQDSAVAPDPPHTPPVSCLSVTRSEHLSGVRVYKRTTHAYQDERQPRAAV